MKKKSHNASPADEWQGSANSVNYNYSPHYGLQTS